MKLTLKTANKIKEDFKNLIGIRIETTEGVKVIQEIAVLPIVNGCFGSFPLHYLLSSDKRNFIIPYKDREMSLVIFLNDDSFIFFFKYLQDNNICFDLTKYTDE